MENKIIITKNGYKVTLRPFLTYDQFIELQKIWSKDVYFDPNDKDKNGEQKEPIMGKIPMNLLYEANKMTVGFLVVRIEDANGSEVVREDVNSLPIPPVDGQKVVDEIKKISDEASAAFDKKKVTTK